jgi:hypothetical protein
MNDIENVVFCLFFNKRNKSSYSGLSSVLFVSTVTVTKPSLFSILHLNILILNCHVILLVKKSFLKFDYWQLVLWSYFSHNSV